MRINMKYITYITILYYNTTRTHTHKHTHTNTHTRTHARTHVRIDILKIANAF